MQSLSVFARNHAILKFTLDSGLAERRRVAVRATLVTLCLLGLASGLTAPNYLTAMFCERWTQCMREYRARTFVR